MSAWRLFKRDAEDALRCARYAEARPSSHVNQFSGEHDGGPEAAARCHKARRQYALCAWILRQVAEGRDAHDVRVAAEAEAAEEARIAALPRVNCWGR
jgi:hypothetical protein